MTAERVAWSADADAGLCETFRGDREYIKADVDEGRAELWKLDNGKAWMITRAEGRELVVVCYQGADFVRWVRTLYQAARSAGYTTARFHTTRPGLARLVPYPVEELERVYRVRID